MIKIDELTFGTIRQREEAPYKYPTPLEPDYGDALVRFVTSNELITLARMFGWCPSKTSDDSPHGLDAALTHLCSNVGSTAEITERFEQICDKKCGGVEKVSCPDCRRFFGLAHHDQKTGPLFEGCDNTRPGYDTSSCPMQAKLAVYNPAIYRRQENAV